MNNKTQTATHMQRALAAVIAVIACAGANCPARPHETDDGRREFGEYETECETGADCVLAWTDDRTCGSCPNDAINIVSESDMLDDLESVQGNCVRPSDAPPSCPSDAIAVCAQGVCIKARTFTQGGAQ